MIGSFKALSKTLRSPHKSGGGSTRKSRSSKSSPSTRSNAHEMEPTRLHHPHVVTPEEKAVVPAEILVAPEFTTKLTEIQQAIERARDNLEKSLRNAQNALEHARQENGIAEQEYERLSHEETQAKEIYQQAEATMEMFVRSSLKQYWRLAQKRKKAAFRTKKAAAEAVEDAREAFEWSLKDALDNLNRARGGKVSPEEGSQASTEGTENTEEEENAVLNNDEDEAPTYLQPHKMFGMFDAKAYLEKMEVEASDVESGDECCWS